MAETACPCCAEHFSSLTVLEEHLNYCGIEPSSAPAAGSTFSSVGQSSTSSFSSSGSTLSSSLSTLSKSSVRKKPRQTQLTLRALKKMDESTQVALALSASLQAPLPVLPSKRGKRGEGKSLFGKLKFAPPPPILIERDPKDSYKIVADRVAVLVAGTSTSEPSRSRWQLPASKISFQTSQEDLDVENNTVEWDSREREELWSLSERLPLRDVQSFYVPSLLSAITPCKEELEAPSRTVSQVPGYRLNVDLNFQHV